MFCVVPAHLSLLVLLYDGFPFESSTSSLSSIINDHKLFIYIVLTDPQWVGYIIHFILEPHNGVR